MNIELSKNIGIAALLILIQVLVLNNIHLFGYGTPLLVVYFLIRSNTGWPRWATLVAGFVTGLVCDIFANTPGVAAAALTLVAMVKPAVLKLFTTYDVPDDAEPTMKSLGVSKYISYSTAIIIVFCFTFFTLEEFTVFHWQRWLANVFGSIVITSLLVLVIENIRSK